jgi:hypothetical protein
MRESKTVTIGERTFVIEQMDAMTGLAVLKELLTQTMSVDLLGQAGFSGLKGLIGGLVGNKETDFDKSVENFIKIETKLLKYVGEILGGTNRVAVLRSDGVFQVPELSMEDILELLIHSIVLNYKDFFLRVLKSLRRSLPKEVRDLSTIQDLEKSLSPAE